MNTRRSMAGLGFVLAVVGCVWADDLPIGGGYRVFCRNACGQDAVDMGGSTVCTEYLSLTAYVANGIQLDLEGSSVVVEHADGPEMLPLTNIQAGIYVFPFRVPARIKPGETGRFPVTITAHPGDTVIPLHFEVHGEEVYATQPTESFSFTLDHALSVFPAGSCPVTTTTTVVSTPPPSTTTTTLQMRLGHGLGVCNHNGTPKKCP